ncbi:hypothetical protein B0H16DRAFT_1472120 [Mycena metata]|uniref:Uncharacterized protein n=1 Tax=Mycena metata TaxID=1033252 RepID=A0AAD7MP73_9AGAR|nr:hypothetical protein B0H16DRAFT_1472120 [Mycena metata]
MSESKSRQWAGLRLRCKPKSRQLPEGVKFCEVASALPTNLTETFCTMNNIIMNDADEDQLFTTDWVPDEWIGNGKIYCNVPAIVEIARRTLLERNRGSGVQNIGGSYGGEGGASKGGREYQYEPPADMHQGSSNASGSQTATSTPPDCATRKLVAANPPNFVNSVQAALQADFNPVASPLPPIPSFVANKPPSKSSLFDLFPSLEASQLLEIVRHEFRPADLYQLNSRFRDIDRPDDSKGRSSANDYPSLHSLINPLFTYFRVLSAFAASSGDAEATRVVGDGSTRYYEHLHDLHQRYEWSAVVEYHLQYHLIRRHEMANGDYSGWGQTNADLMNRFLVHPPL